MTQSGPGSKKKSTDLPMVLRSTARRAGLRTGFFPGSRVKGAPHMMMNGLYLASSAAAAVYLLWIIVRLRSRVTLPALVLGLMLAVHVSRILWVVVTHKTCDAWDVAFNTAYAALAFGVVQVLKMQRRV